MADGINGLPRLIRATRVSYIGLGWALREEEAFRIEFVLFMLLAPLAIWLGDSGVERAILLFSLLLVLITELLNTAVEVTIDGIRCPAWPRTSARPRSIFPCCRSR
jgi:diacylglycerol kinase (ATP)